MTASQQAFIKLSNQSPMGKAAGDLLRRTEWGTPRGLNTVNLMMWGVMAGGVKVWDETLGWGTDAVETVLHRLDANPARAVELLRGSDLRPAETPEEGAQILIQELLNSIAAEMPVSQ